MLALANMVENQELQELQELYSVAAPAAKLLFFAKANKKTRFHFPMAHTDLFLPETPAVEKKIVEDQHRNHDNLILTTFFLFWQCFFFRFFREFG